MSNIGKKLLSWLCVMAMVLSMVPVFQLPAFAAEEATEEAFTPDETVTSAVPAAAQEAIQKAATIRAEAATLDFSGNYCPACGPDVEVTWTKLTRAYPGSNNDSGVTPNWTDTHPHFYWDPADFENGTASYAYMNWLQNVKSGTNVCLHLNGMTFNNVYSRIQWSSSGTLNIMGDGTIINSGDAAKQVYGIFQMTGGTVNLYGGTFVGSGTGLVAPTDYYCYYGTVASLNNAKAVLNMFEGATMEVNSTSESGNNVAISSGTFNLYGGEIKSGKGYPYYDASVLTTGTAAEKKASYDSFTTVGGNILLRYTNANFNMYGGKITGGSAPRGGNIAMYDGAKFNQYAGEISGGTATEVTEGHGGGNIKLQSGEFHQYAGVIQNGTAAYGGNIDTRSKLYIQGLIRDGVSPAEAATKGGSNILAASGCQVWIQEGGRVLRGANAMNIMVYGSGNLYMQDGLIYGGQAKQGANVYLSGNGNLQMTGGVIRDGVAETNGGNIFSQNKDGKITISGGEILNGVATGATSYGGNIRATQGQLTISGGTISGGQAATGGNIYYYTNTASTDTVAYGEYMLSVTGGTISGGTATGNGGNIFAQATNGTRTLNIDNAVISGGVAAGAGGNVYAEGINANIGANAQLLNGISNSADYKGGGNIAFNGAKTLTTAGIIKNGKTTNAGGGGNICIMGGADLKVTGGVIANGRTEAVTGTSWGGNIRSYNTDVFIEGGLIYGGYCAGSTNHNIGALGGETTVAPVLNISGGTIVGDIQISGAKTYTKDEVEYQFPGTAVTLSGAAQILDSYQLEDGTTANALSNTIAMSEAVDISGLTADARICVKGNAGTVFTAPYTGEADLSQVFYAWNPSLIVEQNESGAFQLAKKPFVAPEKPAATLGGNNYTDEAWEAINKAAEIQAEDMAAHVAAGTCPICGDVTWKEATFPGALSTNNAKYHYYIDADTKITYNYNWCTLTGQNQTLCLALINGETVKEIGGLIAVRNGSVNGTLNIMGDGIIDGKDAKGDKIGLLRNQGTNPTMNLYGGTFIRSFVEADNEKPKGAILVADAGTVNIFDGVTIGPETQDLNTANYNVRIEKGIVNMYGGTIQNGVSAYADATNTGLTYRYSGNITMAAAGATFNMYGGTVKNGAYKASVPGLSAGANILGHVDQQFVNIYGGEITGGVAYDGGNLSLYGKNSKLTMMGGTISDGVATNTGGNIRLHQAAAQIGEYALIENGEAKNYIVKTVDGAEVTYALGGGGGNIHNNSGSLTISGGEIRDGKITNETQKNEAGGNASPAGGNIYQTGGNIAMTGGTVKNGSVKQTATGGGNIYVTGGAEITISGGDWIGGSSNNNGGNIYVYRGKLTISGDAEVTSGYAGNAGGNIYKYGGDTGYGNTTVHFVTIGGNAVVSDGTAVKNGGNIYLNASLLTLADQAQIKDGTAQTGGNIYVTGQQRYTKVDGVSTLTDTDYALFRMTGGSIGGGMPATSNSANVMVNLANMEMTGGLIYGTEGATSAGSSLRVGNGSALYLDGDATILRADGVQRFSLQIQGDTGTLRIAKTWTGTATAGFNYTFLAGQTVKINTAAEDAEPDYYYNGLVGTYTSTVDETTGKISFTFEEDTTEAGTFAGTLLQERAPEYYQLMGVNGKLVVASAGIKTADGMQWYLTNEEALAAYTDAAEYITMAGEATLNGQTLKLEMLGNDLTLSGNGTVIGQDQENDDYSGYGKLTIAEGAEIAVSSDEYIVLQSENIWSFHKLGIQLTHVTLRTEGTPGMYYKAEYKCDELLRDRVDSYGVVLSLQNMPGVDFETDGDLNIATAYGADAFKGAYEKGVVNTNSGAVVGIMKTTNTKEVNTANAARTIYANAYLKLDVTGNGDYVTIMADTENAGKTADAEGFSGVAYSLLDVLAAVNANWDTYSAEEQATIKSFVESWAPYITDEAVAQLQTALDKIFAA